MTRCESETAVTTAATYVARTVTPTTRAITPIKSQGTARAAATAPLTGDLAEGNATFG